MYLEVAGGEYLEGPSLKDILLLNKDLSGARLKNVHLEPLNMHKRDFTKSRFVDTAFVYSKISECDFSGSQFWGVAFKDTIFEGCDFSDCRFDKCFFGSTDMHACDFTGVIFDDCSVHRAYLCNNEFSGTEIYSTSFYRTVLKGCNLQFPSFPSLDTMVGFDYEALPNQLVLELMLRDAHAHPQPDRFKSWAYCSSSCPLTTPQYRVSRTWHFQEDPRVLEEHLEQGGNLIPQMTDAELIIALCKAMGWTIRGYPI